jgi:hypothetical protein
VHEHQTYPLYRRLRVTTGPFSFQRKKSVLFLFGSVCLTPSNFIKRITA